MPDPKMPQKQPVASEAAKPADEKAPAQTGLEISIAPDLDYKYRDLFNIFVGVEEVLVEFGNRHRMPGNRGTIADRIVLSVPNAFRLAEGLRQALEKVRVQVQEQAAKAQDQAKAQKK